MSKQLRVLIVEDHQLVGVGLGLILEQLGHELVEVVSTGEEAIVAAERHRPDLILMDIGLEGEMDGVQAAKEIRGRLGVRSVFLTGRTDPETRDRAALAEPVAFLDKTLSEGQLQRAINALNAEGPPPSGPGACRAGPQ